MSAKRRRGASLADEIAELLDTRPSDPTADDEDIDRGGDSGGEEPRELLAEQDRPAAMGRRRMRGTGDLDLGEMGAKYAGKVTSRATLETRDSLRKRPQVNDDEEEEEGEEESEDDGNEDGEEGEEEVGSDDNMLDGSGDDNDEDDDDEDDDDDDDDDDNDDDDDDDDDEGAVDEAGGLYGQWSSAQQEEKALPPPGRRDQTPPQALI